MGGSGMVFSSNEFLFFYLPFFLVFYFATPKRHRNATLFFMSLVFYAWERPLYLPLMLFCIGVNFALGYFVGDEGKSKPARQKILALAIVLNLAVLGFFKYADFIAVNLSKIPLFGFIKPLGISLPIGISFYTFQSMSYVIDVYRADVKRQTSFIGFGTYVAMFPQLIAGPIVRYSNIDRQLSDRRVSLCESSDGARRFVVGLSKKVLLADTAGELWEQILETPREENSVLLMWLGIIFYAFQIYFDFSGYSDMGIGLGKLLGFHFPENFNYPYVSRSITEFWRRWHITLSSWFREYVYIPLGGNRVGRARLLINLFAVWFLTGLWHGASWNFIIWGVYYFVLLAAEKLFLKKYLDRLPRLISRVYTLVLVLFGWLIFYFKSSVGGMDAFSSYFGGMLGFTGLPLVNSLFFYTLARSAVLLVLLTLGSTPLPGELFNKLKDKRKNRRDGADLVLLCVRDGFLVMIFLLCIAYISASEYRPNIYFEF